MKPTPNDVIKYTDDFFDKTRKLRDKAMNKAAKIEVLANIYVQAMETSIEKFGSDAFVDDSMLADKTFRQSLDRLCSTGVKVSYDEITEHVVNKINSNMLP